MSEQQRILFVVNPISGIMGKRAVVAGIPRLLASDRFAYDIAETAYAGHATELARSAANRGVDIVCAVGGDGTVNEVAKALLHTHTALAIVPLGSGNGLARHLHIPIDAARAIGLINHTPAHHIDYGLVNAHPFFCTCGVGFDALVSQKFAEAKTRGPLSYIEQVLRHALTYNPETYQIDIEDEHGARQTLRALIIACANASQYGNNLYIAPQASVRDALLDVTVLLPFNILEAPQVALQLLNGKFIPGGCIRTFRCRHLLIRRSQRGPIHFDGEPIEADPLLDVSLVHRGLLCICPTDEGVPSPAKQIENAFTETISHINMWAEEILENLRSG